ncbi:MAG: raffinose/stachyose/melibiose transport system permease protein [Verrucomicrobiota bacterium]
MNPKASNSARYAILSCFAVVILYPFALMIFGSLKTETAFLANPVSPPTTFELRNYQFAWNEARIPKFALNSLIVSAGTVLLTLVTGSMAAFALSRIRFRGRSSIYLAFVLLLTVPVQIYIIPLYIIIVRAHLSDSLVGLILPYTTGSLPLAVFLLKTYFDQLPSEVMDAARLDGCSNRMILLKVVLPLSRPVLSTVAIFTFVQSWNEFFLALVFIHNPDLQTLPLGLQAFFVNQYETQFPQLFATLALSIAPVVMVYLFLQKQFIAGLTAGAVKT